MNQLLASQIKAKRNKGWIKGWSQIYGLIKWRNFSNFFKVSEETNNKYMFVYLIDWLINIAILEIVEEKVEKNLIESSLVLDIENKQITGEINKELKNIVLINIKNSQ